MSRKRALKKLQKRQESALAHLEELYLKGAGDEFLALAAEQLENPAASPLAAEWAEVAERAVRESLSQGDLGRLERLLRSLRRGGRLRPLAALAEAVLDLAAGHLETARSRLAALAGPGEAAGAFPPDLLPSLLALAQDEPAGGRDEDEPQDEPCLRASRELFGAFQRLATDACAPTAADCRDLARSLADVQAAAPREEVELRRLFDGAGRCLSLLIDLADLAARPLTGQRVTDWLRDTGPALAAALTASGPPLLAPLHHAVRLRWRAVLERVAALEGSPGLAALCAAEPKLLARDVDMPPGGLAVFRQAAQARQLLAGRRYGELARLLRIRSQEPGSRGDLAILWSLELWASKRGAQQMDADEVEEEDWLEDLDLLEPPPCRVLLRLMEMAGEIGRRLPIEQRATVARGLREELFDLCEQLPFCAQMARVALSLLDHQPGDAGLLIVGVAGAIAGGDSSARRALAAQIPHGGKIADLDIARRLMTPVATEDPSTIAEILDVLKPLFAGNVWQVVAALIAGELGRGLARSLHEMSVDAVEEPALAGRVLAVARRKLDRLRPSLAETSGFAAMDLILACWPMEPSAVEIRLGQFLATSPGIEGPLTAVQLLANDAGPATPRSIAVALCGLAEAVIDRLDDRWQLWGRDAPFLAFTAGKTHRRRLDKKIRKLLASPEIPAEGREILGLALAAVARIQDLRRERNRAGRRPAPRRTGSPQLRLDV